MSYKRTKEIRKKISEALTGRRLSEEHKNHISDGTRGKNVGIKLSEDHRKKLSEAKMGKGGNKCNRWMGGFKDYYHQKAKELFGSPYCQECNISLEEYLQSHKHSFDMHCVSKDFRALQQWNWYCVCRKCHKQIHRMEK